MTGIKKQNIDYDYFFNDYSLFLDTAEEYIDKKIIEIKEEINDYSILFNNIITLLNSRLEEYKKTGIINSKLSFEDQIQLFDKINNSNTSINSFFLDYCEFTINDEEKNPEKEKTLFIRLLLELLNIKNSFGFYTNGDILDSYFINYFYDEVLLINNLVEELIDNNTLIKFINENNIKRKGKTYYYIDDRNLYIINSNNFTFKLKSDNDGVHLASGYDGNEEKDIIGLTFDGGDRVYNTNINDFNNNVGKKILFNFSKNNIKDIDIHLFKLNDEIIQNNLLKQPIEKLVVDIEQSNGFSNMFGMGGITEIYSPEQADKIIDTYNNILIYYFVLKGFYYNENITAKNIINNIKKIMKK